MIEVEPPVPLDPQAAAEAGPWAAQRLAAVDALAIDARVEGLIEALTELDDVLTDMGGVSLSDDLVEVEDLEVLDDSESEAEAFIKAERQGRERMARAETIVLSGPEVRRKIRLKQSIVPEHMATNLYADVRSLFEIGDREGALVSLERLIVVAPLSPQVDAFLNHNEPRLMEYYLNVFGPFDRVLSRPEGPNPMPSAYFTMDKVERVWALVDGQRSVRETIDMSGLREVEACAVISQLVRSTAVTVSAL